MEQTSREGKRAAKIRHIAIRATDVEGMANFFINAFGMTVANRRKNGSIDLSDGTINLAILPLNLAGQRPGFDHIGFAVDAEDDACARLEANGARNIKRSQTRRFDVGQNRWNRSDDQLHLATYRVYHRRRAAFIGNMHHGDAGSAAEHLHRKMQVPAGASGVAPWTSRRRKPRPRTNNRGGARS